MLLAPSAYYPNVGGIEELTRQLAVALAARGHQVAVLTNRWPGGAARSEILGGTLVTRLRFPLPAARPGAAARFVVAAPAATVALIQHLRRWRPDVVHVIGAGPQAVYLAMLRARPGTRLVFTAQGELTFDAHSAFERSVTLRAGLRRILRTAHAVTACSEFVMHSLAGASEIGGLSRVIPNGVDPYEFRDIPVGESAAPYVLAVGRLVPQKGFDVLLEAFGSELLAGLSLVLAGDGFERPRLEARVAELGLGSRVRFLGSVNRSDLGQLLRGARAFAFPSRGEPFGIALLEAMAAGVPAVATAAGGVPEFARDGENALLVQTDDSDALAAAIAKISTDMPLRERLVLGGDRTAAELAWSRIAVRYEDVYLGVLGGSM